MPLMLKETNTSTEHNRLKKEELNRGLPRNNSSLVIRAGLEPVTNGFQALCPNHSATLPPSINLLVDKKNPEQYLNVG